MTHNDLATQLKQIDISDKIGDIELNFQNMIECVTKQAMAYNDLVTQLKQTFITQPKF